MPTGWSSTSPSEQRQVEPNQRGSIRTPLYRLPDLVFVQDLRLQTHSLLNAYLAHTSDLLAAANEPAENVMVLVGV